MDTTATQVEWYTPYFLHGGNEGNLGMRLKVLLNSYVLPLKTKFSNFHPVPSSLENLFPRPVVYISAVDEQRQRPCAG